MEGVFYIDPQFAVLKSEHYIVLGSNYYFSFTKINVHN
jgi:hypothetical protein